MNDLRKDEMMKIFDQWGIKYAYCKEDLEIIMQEIITVFEANASLKIKELSPMARKEEVRE